MFRTFLLLVLTSISLLPVNTYGQNNTRPNIVVPNGFEVNSYTGNLYHSRTDLRIPGQGLTIDISFSYNVSRRSRNRGFGKGWTFTYNMAYVIETDGIRVERPDGRSDLYRKSGATYLTPKGLFDALVEYQTGKFYIETKEGLRYYFDNATHKRMTKMQDTNGNLINLAYTDTLLNTITDAAGHSLAFTWSNGLLSEIADNSCTPSRKISYDYDTKGNPVKVINPVGDQVQYYYDPTAKIIGYTDAAGNNMSIVYNSNSAVLKVASCATTHVFSYVPQQSKTYVTEQVNSQKVITTYTFDTQGRIASKKGNCCGFNVDYTYDTENNVISRRDGNNKQNAYEYDSKGNVTKETDATGNSTTYTYEPTHNKVASITDKNGNTTTYQYNAAGNLIQVNKPLSVTEKHTYDAKGNRLTDTDGNNNVTSYEYNNNGYLTKVTDAAGGITTFTYDCHGNRLSETDARNHTTTFQYNGINQLITKTDALGNLTTYTYDKLGGLVSLTNALGKKTQYIYDGLGRRISTILPAGNATYTAYDEQGNISKETNGNGQSITYTYNNRKQPLTITDALGNVMSYEYDEAGNKLRETDKNGNTTRFEYDDLYRLLKRTNALGGTTTYSYDAVGNRIAEVDANGNATTFQYDALRRLAKVTDALNKSITYTYDQNGNRLTEKDKAGNVTTYTYDKLNRVKTITDALNGVTTYTYDANGNMLIETDPLNHSITHTYDALNRQITSANALNEITTYTYDAIGNNKTIVKANGNTITNTYDDNSRLLTQSDDIGAIITYTYDNNDNTISRKDAGNHITTYQYDAANRPTKITFPNNTTFQFSYDAYGNKIKEINQSGDSTVFSYDKLNRTASIKDALGHISRFTYDAQGNLTNLIDAKGNTTSYSYDIRNKIAKQTYSDGSSKIFAYDANGLLISRTTGNGIQTQYKYDKLNRLTERQYPGNISDLFSYDAAGRMLTAINTNATVSFEYDAPGRVTKENLNGVSTTYTYSIANRTKTINYPGGMQILWQADKRERLIGINEGGNSLVTFQYNINDQLVNKQYRNTTSTDYTYDSMGNLTSLVSIPNTILNMNYQYDNSDNRTVTQRINKPAFSEQYTYDKLFQLSSFKSGQYANGVLTPTGTQEFSYDALGNRISTSENQLNKTYTVNNVNQYTSILTNGSNDPPAYDLTGNITSDGLNSYTYDTENRLLSIQNNTGTITYKYDALGRRISREKNGTVKLYFYSQNEVIEERVNSAIKSFIYGAGIDNILFAKTTTASYFYHTDDLNSVHALTDASGTLIEYYTYDPFGNPHVFNAANVELTTSSINNLLFTGREYDFDYKVYNYRSRDMNPSLGRFAQRDPLEYVDGLNNYAYVNNNVINNTDPLGLVRVWGVVGAVGGIIGNGIGFAGSVIFGVVTSPTVGGAAVGVAGAGYFGYGVFANAENLAAAWADEDPLSTGGALGDGAKEFFPCNETLQALGEAGDFLLGLANPSQIARGIGRLGNAIDEAGGLAGIAGKGADWLSNAASRGAGLLDDALTRGSGLVDNIVGRIKGNPSVGNEVTSGGTDLARKLGKAGEEAVGTIGPKTRIPSATGTAQYRIPDQLTSTSLIEVKNVEHLGLTAQIKDFYIYSQQTGREFIIYTRPNTTFSKPLQDLINQGTIVVKPIPFR